MLTQWTAAWERHKGKVGDMEKYSDLPAEIVRNKKLHAGHLPDPVSKCLDISAGAGVFAYILKSQGCTVYLTDPMNRHTLCQELWAVLGVADHIEAYSVKPGSPVLPFEGETFDFISATACPPMSMFTAPEWLVFIEAALARLNPGGVLYLRPNRSDGLDRLKVLAADVPKNKISRIEIDNKYVKFKRRERCVDYDKEAGR